VRDVPTIEPRRKGRSGMQSMLITSQQMVTELIRSAPAGAARNLAFTAAVSLFNTELAPAAR